MFDTQFQNFQVHRDDRGVVTVRLNVPNRPVNVFDESVIAELESLVQWLQACVDVKAVVFTSAKPSGFLAGADVTKIATLSGFDEATAISSRGKRLFDRLEQLRMPTFAVIHGPCLGGGLEFALACRFRIARDDATTKLGLPEVQLGLLPGWGGTQRLPRLVGVTHALPMILQSKNLSAASAAAIGLVDLACPPERFDEEVQWFVTQVLVDPHFIPPRHLAKPTLLRRLADHTKWGRSLVFRTVRRKIGRRAHDYPATIAVLEAVRRGTQQSPAAGAAYETESFGRLLLTPTCRNLLRIFFQRERARNAATWVRRKADCTSPNGPSLQRIGIVGAGVMGAGIAQLAAKQGFEVVLKDIDERTVAGGMERIGKLFDNAVAKGRLPADEATTRIRAVTPTVEWDVLANMDLIVEAVTERADVKRHIFEELDQHVHEHTALTTNTSSLSVEQLAAATQHPPRVAGLHFFNPVHRMELVEIVRTDETSDEVLETLVRFVRRLGKTPLLVKDSPGFLVNRILFPYLAEAARLVTEGLDVSAIDGAMIRFGMPMGPLELLDQVGMDVALDVARSLAPVLCESQPTVELLNEMVDHGWLGKKSGRGFYHYRRGRRGTPARKHANVRQSNNGNATTWASRTRKPHVAELTLGESPDVERVMEDSIGVVRRHRQAGTILGRDRKIREDVLRDLAEVGYWGLLIGRKYGGAAAPFSAFAPFLTRMATLDPTIAGLASVHGCIGAVDPVRTFGTPEQKQRFLPRLASGERLSGFALTEPGAGSDLTALRTTAVRQGDQYVVRGEKLFITNVLPGRTVGLVCLVEARPAVLIVDLPNREDEHFQLVRYGLYALKHTHNYGIRFREFRVPVSNLLEPAHGDGLTIAYHGLNLGRVSLCANAAGTMRMMMASMIPWSRFRHTYGAAIAKRELVQRRLGHLAGLIVACDALVQWCSGLIDQGYRGEMECIVAKVFGSESQKEAAIELHMKTRGGRSFLHGHLFGDHVHEYLAPCIYEGEGEMLGMAFFKSLVKNHGQQFFEPIGKALQAARISKPNLLNPAHAWALKGPLWNYARWYASQKLRPRQRPELPDMPDEFRKHAEFAAAFLRRGSFEITATMRKHQLKLADRQCRMSELSFRLQTATVILCTSLYAARHNDPLIRDAADCICQQLTLRLTGKRPSDRYFRQVTQLGAAISDGGFESIADLHPDEILMPYESH